MWKSTFFCSLLYTLCSTAICWSATYFVDATNGNDTNPGTSKAKPWKTISKVNKSRFQPRDFILFKRGETWREQLIIPSSGAPSNPITFGAYGTGDKAVISGADDISTAGWVDQGGNVWRHTIGATEPTIVMFDGVKGTVDSTPDAQNEWTYSNPNLDVYSTSDPDSQVYYTVIEASQRDYGIAMHAKSYITIDGLDLQGGKVYGGLFIWTKNAASSNVTVQNCTIRNNYGHGLNVTNAHATYKTTEVLIKNNTVYGNGSTGILIGDGVNIITISNNTVYQNNNIKNNYTAGIRVNSIDGVDGDGTIIEYNNVYNNRLSGNDPWVQGNGIHLDYVASGALVRYNNVYDNESVGILIEASANAKVYYNEVYGNTDEGILVYRIAGGCQVYNNVSYGNRVGIGIRGYDGGETGMIAHSVKNNICLDNTERALTATFGGENDGTMGGGNVYGYNCFGVEGSNFIEWGNGVYKSTYDDWETAYGSTTNSAEADPLFISTSNFRLQATSPCINAGINVGLTQDYAGNSLSGSAWDIGAFEYEESITPLKVPVGLRLRVR